MSNLADGIYRLTRQDGEWRGLEVDRAGFRTPFRVTPERDAAGAVVALRLTVGPVEAPPGYEMPWEAGYVTPPPGHEFTPRAERQKEAAMRRGKRRG